MRIGFLENKLTPRGTSVTLYNMAHYNEQILKNISFIITRPYELVKYISPIDVTEEAYKKFEERFSMIYYTNTSELEKIVTDYQLDLLFIEKSGSHEDGLIVNNCETFIHAVFDTTSPHGTYYCCISDSLNLISKTNIPVLPYMVEVYDTQENLKKELNIKNDSIVFGCYCGADCFNIQYIQQVVRDISSSGKYPDIYFIFMNVNQFCESGENVKFLPGTCDLKMKRKFINTCDAMLYGRDGGETFGLACGEFSLCDKPVICRDNERCDSHLLILGNDAIKHKNYEELSDIIINFKNKYNKSVINNHYKDYTPEKVMDIFEKIITKPKVNFISFGGPTQYYHDALSRICNEAKNFNIFDEIKRMTEIDLKNDKEFWMKHNNFIENNKTGYGMWIWKPYIIKKQLERMRDNDILLYADAGCTLNLNGKNRLEQYIQMLREGDGIICFQMPHLEKFFTKMDMIDYMNAHEYKSTGQINATSFLIQKRPNTVELVNKWYNISCNYNLLDNSQSIIENDPGFIAHRNDQSIWSILCKSYKCTPLEDETWLFYEGYGITFPIWATRRFLNNPINYKIDKS